MACMDDVPQFVIQYEIMPYLTYEEKIYLNQSLKPIHRVSKKIPLKDLVQHECYTITQTFLGYLDKQKKESTNGIVPKKINTLKQIFLYCLRPEVLKLIVSIPSFKDVIMRKCEEFSSKENEHQYVNYILKDKKTVVYLTKLVLIKIKEFEFDGYKKFIVKGPDGKTIAKPYLK